MKSIYVYVTVSIIAICVLSGFLIKCTNEKCSKDNYESIDMCLCTGMGNKLCHNREEVINSYNKGNTEYQDFGEMQKQAGGPFWNNTNFNEY
jgi:hypothetical protein